MVIRSHLCVLEVVTYNSSESDHPREDPTNDLEPNQSSENKSGNDLSLLVHMIENLESDHPHKNPTNDDNERSQNNEDMSIWLQLERIVFQQRQQTIPCGNYGRQKGPSKFHWGREERIAGS
ncbi:Hypothetical predicted protein [Paramuricea clavata]|uniref:Uncharacterized protein n=1 Tax=Paramuricea clavata TaxID=317549 RepID=A0A6S7GLU4_PARCT|nr:Hypothetical predicted protein [Paramuricea clavata]